MQNNIKFKIIFASLLPAVLLLGVLLFGGLNISTDYATGNVVMFKLAEEKEYNEVYQKLDSIRDFSKLESFEDSEFHAFYQNVDLDVLTNMKSEVEDELGITSEYGVYVYNPTTLVLISGRILYGIYAFVIIYLIVLAYNLKKSGITRMSLIWQLVGDLIVLGLLATSTIGLVNLLGFLGLNITSHVVGFGIIFYLYSMYINIFASRNITIKNSTQLGNEWISNINNLKSNNIKYYLIIGSVLIAYLAINLDFLLLIPVFVFTVLYSLLLHAFFKPILLDWLIAGGKNVKLINKNKLLSKEW